MRLLLIITTALTLTPMAQATSPDKPDYIRSGDEVEARYLAYTKRLEEAHAALLAALGREAPELRTRLEGPPPKPVAYGYQILPKIIPNEAREEDKEQARATSSSYSWSRTEQYIESELPKVEEIEEKLKILSKLSELERKRVLEKIVADYPSLASNQKTIDHHIQYNRFWQKEIAADRERFNRLTKLHDLVLERQAILDKPNPSAEDRIREQQLARIIHGQNEQITPPDFIKVRKPKPHVVLVEVPLFTDIQDAKFIARFKSAVERVWFVEHREYTYKVKLTIKQLSPDKLYKSAKPPHRGARFDVRKHVTRFPKGGGILTTGSNSTYAIPGHYVALGPQDITENVLAHEFGHILGFIDGYFRGYRDRGDQGFEVLEVIPDPTDIMCTPGSGKVLTYHFDRLLPAKPEAAVAAPGPK